MLNSGEMMHKLPVGVYRDTGGIAGSACWVVSADCRDTTGGIAGCACWVVC